MRRTALCVLMAAFAAGGLTAAPARAAAPHGPCTAGATGIGCHFDVAPGTYDVSVVLGGETAARTSVTAEIRRAMLPETATAAGRTVRRSFTVDVRTPEGEPTGATGTPGLDLTFGGAAPALSGIRVTPAPARSARKVLLVGDSTGCDQAGAPYAGWGQQLSQYLRRGAAVANHADSGESTVSYLADPRLFDTVEARIQRGDLVLVQLAHNDKQTDEATYRSNLSAMVDRIRARGGRPVLVTPIVRRWFNADGTLNNPTALLVNGLGVDHPAVLREVAAARDVPLIDLTARTKQLVESLGTEASKALYLTNEARDNTHTSEHGATVYAGLVRDALRAQHLLPERDLR
ncbi:rhamnogalacturonan acetylesterase [Streptomyces violens]|uniref:rhamnogalacturonan acetylesterase n=1 Tax=Streptomyces violens TaxID=66377 RepID=UPI0004C0E2DD|nr:rhamnogalacturonan acetylesterase [Streptomyces violens]